MPTQAEKQSALPTSAMALFARNFLKYPLMLGSVIPSSPFLVNDMLAEVDWNRARVIVEFGPGVGTITREALKRMRRDAVLIVIELNEDFVHYLRATSSRSPAARGSWLRSERATHPRAAGLRIRRLHHFRSPL